MRRSITALILSQLTAAGLTACSTNHKPADPAPSATVPTPPSAAAPTPTAGQRGDAAVGETCRNDDDCVAGLYCQLGFDGAEFSETGSCVTTPPIYEGRPLVIDGAPRLAALVASSAWSNPAEPALLDDRAHGLSPWASRWLAAGREEHASIAAFAHTCRSLLALGAPPALVAANLRALHDEIRHATISFGWVEALAGDHRGPGALALDDLGMDPRALLDDLFWGGCVGETLAAHRAIERSAHAPSEAMAESYRHIARDEARHAALAFRGVAWLVEAYPELRPALATARASFERRASGADRAKLLPLLAVLEPAPRLEVRAHA
ncbi:MAG: hypothetical protein KC731_06910 [Myxococcales bacterium]|nr:hypothetical protein [Myxococcales bacterium]